jgi:DNA repair exonuclease SbcCD ATPase subunit
MKGHSLTRWVLIGIIGLVGLVALIAFGLSRRNSQTTVNRKEEIRAIHEREVQKAIQELAAEKATKKKDVETRKTLLRTRKKELQVLNAELRNVQYQKAEELDELDRIRRPFLPRFRSRAKKQAEIAEQMQVIENLNAKAATIRSRMARCQAAIDSLSEGVAR